MCALSPLVWLSLKLMMMRNECGERTERRATEIHASEKREKGKGNAEADKWEDEKREKKHMMMDKIVTCG